MLLKIVIAIAASLLVTPVAWACSPELRTVGRAIEGAKLPACVELSPDRRRLTNNCDHALELDCKQCLKFSLEVGKEAHVPSAAPTADLANYAVSWKAGEESGDFEAEFYEYSDGSWCAKQLAKESPPMPRAAREPAGAENPAKGCTSVAGRGDATPILFALAIIGARRRRQLCSSTKTRRHQPNSTS